MGTCRSGTDLYVTSVWPSHITVPGVVPATLLGYFGSFVAGMLLARLSPASTRPLSVPPWAIWALVALGYLFVARHLTPLGHPAGLGAKAWDYIGVGLLGAAAVLPAVTNPGRSHLRWLGDRSYGVYLWHFPAFMFLSQRASISSWAYIVAGTAATLLAAHLSYGYLERPLMNKVTARQQRRLARRPPTRCATKMASASIHPQNQVAHAARWVVQRPAPCARAQDDRPSG